MPDLPTDRAKLRRWRNADLELWPWGSAAVDDPRNHNRDLMVRFEAVLQVIESRRRRARGRGRLQLELEFRDRCIEALERRGLELLDENNQLRRELADLLGARAA